MNVKSEDEGWPVRPEPEHTARTLRAEQQQLSLTMRLERAEWRMRIAMDVLEDLANWKSCDINDMRNEARFALKLIGRT